MVKFITKNVKIDGKIIDNCNLSFIICNVLSVFSSGGYIGQVIVPIYVPIIVNLL